LRFKKLDSQRELSAYRAGFLKFSAKGADLPIEYLLASRVVGIFANGELVAGYTIGTQAPLRLLEFVPEESRSELALPPSASWSDFCEVACVWREPRVSSLIMSCVVWPRILLDVLRTRKRFLLGHNQSKALDRFYTTLGPWTLYSGRSSFGYDSRLFAYSRAMIAFSILVFWVYETPRRVFRSARGSGSRRILDSGRES
jgi:hypothetical protein